MSRDFRPCLNDERVSAQSVLQHISSPTFERLVNREKPLARRRVMWRSLAKPRSVFKWECESISRKWNSVGSRDCVTSSDRSSTVKRGKSYGTSSKTKSPPSLTMWVGFRARRARRTEGRTEKTAGGFSVIPASADWPQGAGKDSLATIAQNTVAPLVNGEGADK